MEKEGAGALVRIELAESRALEVRLRLTCWLFDFLVVSLYAASDLLRREGDINEARRRHHNCLRLHIDQQLSRLGSALIVLQGNTCTCLSAGLQRVC